MSHIDEHTLELFILEASEVAEQHDAIASHLRRCPACSALSAEIAEFYELTAIHYSDRPATDEAGKISGLPDDPHLRAFLKKVLVFPSDTSDPVNPPSG